MNEVTERCLLERFARLPRAHADALMGHGWVPPALLRLLPEAGRNFAARLLLCPAPLCGVSDAAARAWAASAPVAAAAVDQLRALHIADVDRRAATLRTNPLFVAAVRPLIISDGVPVWAMPSEADASADPSAEAVEAFAGEQWALLVAAVVAGGGSDPNAQQRQQQQLSQGVAEILERAGVLLEGRLTTNGFQFLLRDRRAQVWTLLSAIADERDATDDGATATDDSALSLLLRLGFFAAHVPVSAEDFGDVQCRVLGELSELGLLVYQPARQRFFLSKTLHDALQPRTCADQQTPGATSIGDANDGVIVEANFRVYVLTSSPTLIALVRLFATPLQRLPGLFVASITRASVRRALLNGITAAQIEAFLRKNAHPTAAARPPVVPETVLDQIRLWEHERSRIAFEPAVLLDSFPTREQFAQLRARAARKSALIWSSDRLQQLFRAREEGTPRLCGEGYNMKELYSVWKGKYRDAAYERAYTEFYLRTYDAPWRAAFYCLQITVLLTAFAAYVGLRNQCYRCSDRVFVLAAAVMLVVVFLLFLLRQLSTRVSLLPAALMWLLLSVGCTTTIALQVFMCPTQVSTDAPLYWRAQLADYAFPSTLHALIGMAFLHFGPMTWPNSGVIVSLAALADVLLLAFITWGKVPIVIATVGCGNCIALLSAALINDSRRRAFIAAIGQIRELHKLKAEQRVTETIQRALFPREIADRLTSSHRDSTSSAHRSVIADLFRRASIVWMCVDGVEHLQPFDTQLEVLSQIFIAADRLAEQHGATTIKPVGTHLVFACGIPRRNDAHERMACELAIALQQLIHSFSEKRGITCITARVGISSGPVVAGIIGIARPKYDVWGHTVDVASRLAQAAPPRAIVTTRSVAIRKQDEYNFKLMKRIALVEGVGKIFVFKLQLSEFDRITPVAFNSEPSDLSLLEQSAQPQSLPSIEDTARSLHAKEFPLQPTSFFTNRFKDKAFNAQYVAEHLVSITPFIRWISFSVATITLLYWLTNLGFSATNLRDTLLEILRISCYVAPFILSYFKCMHRHVVVYASLLFFFGVASTTLQTSFFLIGKSTDPISSDALLVIVWAHYARLPIFLSTAISVLTVLLSVHGYNQPYGLSPLVLIVSLVWVVVPAQWAIENEVRKTYWVNCLLRKTSSTVKRHKAESRALVFGAVPQRMVERVLTTGTSETHLTEYVSSGTTMVCKIVGFESLLRTLKPTDLVSLLNDLLSKFDRLAALRHLEPLKTIGDEYIVVGNVLNDMPKDHAIRVVGLAGDIMGCLSEFNASRHPAPPISLKISVHTDQLLSGIIRMKSFIFDVWGNGINYCEQFCAMAPPGSVVISQATNDLVSSQFLTQVFGDFVVSSREQLRLFLLLADQSCPPFTLDDSVVPMMPCSPQPISSSPQGDAWSELPDEVEDYGVFSGAGNVVDKESAMAHGFAIFEATTNTTATSTGPAAAAASASSPRSTPSARVLKSPPTPPKIAPPAPIEPDGAAAGLFRL